MAPSDPAPRCAAVVGSPIEHSLSPVLHEAAYRALGLTGWRFERIDCEADDLAGLVADLGPEWAGLAVTMPDKRAALALSAERTARASAVGAANTLVPLAGGGWRADCTDVSGVIGALTAAAGFRAGDGTTGVLLGSGATAAAVLAGLAELGVRQVTLVVRDPARAAETVATASRVGVQTRVEPWSEVDFANLAATTDVLVSTVPAVATAPHAASIARAPYVLDVIYHPWPTPIAEAVRCYGGRLATGLDMLLHQAFDQVEQFTGAPAPREAMREALRTATGGVLPLPLD